MPTTTALARLTTSPVEHAGERVITLGMMDEAHERPSGTAKRAFAKHRDRLVEGEDYFRRDEKRPVGTGGKLAGREPEVLRERRASRARLGFGQPKRPRRPGDDTLPLKVVR